MSLCASSSPTIEFEHYQQLSTILENKMHNDIQKPNTQARTEQKMEKTTGHRVVHMLATRDSKHTQSPGYQPTQPRGGRGGTHPRHPCHLLAEQKVPPHPRGVNTGLRHKFLQEDPGHAPCWPTQHTGERKEWGTRKGEVPMHP